MNSLPRPTTLDCFIESLERPLSVYLTTAVAAFSRRPGHAAQGPLSSMAILAVSLDFAGEASETLELGYRTRRTAPIKTQIIIPLQLDITLGGCCSSCGGRKPHAVCGLSHGEMFTFMGRFPKGSTYERARTSVGVHRWTWSRFELKRRRGSGAQSNRCGMLDAFFDYGEVQPSS